MRSFRNPASTVGHRRPAFAAAFAGLFPEIAGHGGLRLTEGWLRAPSRGGRPPPCLSGVVREAPDGRPLRCPVSVEGVLAARGWEEPALLARGSAGRRALAAARAGGDWWHGGDAASLPADGGLVIVAPRDAESSTQRDARRAAAMLDRALAENAAGRVVLLATDSTGRPPAGVTTLPGGVDPWLLLDRAARIYSAGGELGFLALASGIPVTVFAPSFYSGWGVTDDLPGVPQRSFRRSVDEIFTGAVLVASRYRDPFHDAPASFEEMLALLADWRRLDEANRQIAVCVGMSWWKRRRIREFVCSSAGAPCFRRTADGALKVAQRAPGAIAGWASRLPEGLAEGAARTGLPLIRVEDGFIRSVGLGADFLPPASLVCDRRGMYFDPRQRSDLEELLATTDFATELLARARRLTARLVARGITKYNLPGDAPALDLPAGKRRILVPGQVEDEVSLAYGGVGLRSNLGLLAAVRAANPNAVILYKPHPDVAAGHRNGAVPEASARRFADRIVGRVATAALLGLVDEVHTMTSLAGFEALLRGRHVVVYGRPFYAGWGLTDDRPPFERGRHLALDELVAGALILYPRYLDPLTRLPCGPEIVIERLEHPELWRAGPLVLARRLQGILARRLSEARAMLPMAGSVPVRGLSERPRH